MSLKRKERNHEDKVPEFFLLTFTLVVSPSLFADTDAKLDARKTPHGGQIRSAGPYHLELVAQPNTFTIYVMDHKDNKVESKGASATATALSGNVKDAVKLIPAGDNVLKGEGKFDLNSDMKVVVSITLPGQSSHQARFTPLQKVGAKPGDK